MRLQILLKRAIMKHKKELFKGYHEYYEEN